MKLDQLEHLEFVELTEQEAQQINGGTRVVLPIAESYNFYNPENGQLVLRNGNLVTVSANNPGLIVTGTV